MTHKLSQRPIREMVTHVPTGASYCPDGTGHSWKIQPPNGPTSEGTCRKCGETRDHRNSTDDALGYSDGNVLRGLGRADYS